MCTSELEPCTEHIKCIIHVGLRFENKLFISRDRIWLYMCEMDKSESKHVFV